MLKPDDIRTELTLKNAEAPYKRKGPDVVEVYSRPRLCQEASSQKFSGVTMRPGWSLDFTMPDPTTGEQWDLADVKVQSRVVKLIKESDLFCIVGSPPCTPFSRLQELNKGKRCPKIVRAEFGAGRRHIQFCLRLYEMQMSRGKHFAHEHPSTSTAWDLPEMIEFIMRQPVEVVTTHMCEFGMKTKDERRGIGAKGDEDYDIIAGNRKKGGQEVQRPAQAHTIGRRKGTGGAGIPKSIL